MSKLFTNVKRAKTPRSAFDLSHERKLSCKMGQLIPIMCDEIVPGDKFRVRTEVLVRMAPMIAPVMHRTNVFVHYFFVPNRIIWDQWEEFITGQDELLVPRNQSSTPITGKSIHDYLGLPVGLDMSSDTVSQLPLRAYYKIWNEYYRDQNQQAELDVENLGSTYLNGSAKPLLRAWEKDYFTSALPSTQQGSPVGIPVSPNYIQTGSIATNPDDGFANPGPLTVGQGGAITDGTEAVIVKNLIDGQENVIDIRDFRVANRLQQWAERQMRSGNRYVETLLSHFGVSNNDLRLQRPQYLGGGKMPVTVSEVLNTSAFKPAASAGEGAPLGEMAGHGIGVGTTPTASARFTEHGWIMGIMSVMPRTAYNSQGIHRSWLRQDKFQFYWPEFANYSEHAVLNKELYVSPDEEYNDGVFGYQSQYSDLKYKMSSVHGDFRTNLNFYHMARIFSETPDPLEGTLGRPNLNEDFIMCDSTTINNRVFATGNEADTLWVQLYNAVTAIRPMPYYGTPRL